MLTKTGITLARYKAITYACDKDRVMGVFAFFTIHKPSGANASERNKVNSYIVKNMMTGAVIVVQAHGRINALRRGREQFSEPNRSPIPVRLLGV